MPGNPLGLQKDDMVFERADGAKTAALLANVSGTDLHLVEVAGSFGRELAGQGEAAMIAFAGDWLASLFGNNAKRSIKRSHATLWNADPLDSGDLLMLSCVVRNPCELGKARRSRKNLGFPEFRA